MNSRLILLMIVVALLYSFALSSSASASDKQVLYTFQGGTDGEIPVGQLVFDSSGNAYGVTFLGGDLSCDYSTARGCGTVYELIPGANGWTHVVLHSFAGGADGAIPGAGLVIDSHNNLYGTTEVGGGANRECDDGCGTVFELSPGPTGWTETVIHDFAYYHDGAYPGASVTLGASGQLYGTDISGGPASHGAVFELIPQPGGAWTENTIHSFQAYGDGMLAQASVTLGATGELYGATANGGVYSYGTVYRLRETTSGKWAGTNLHEFTNGPDGGNPSGGVVVLNGALIGITDAGGAYDLGVVYRLTPKEGEWRTEIIHTFTGQDDGARPYGNLATDSSDNLYGTATLGGYYEYGTVFELIPKPNGGWSETVLYNFKGGDDGEEPSAGVVYQAGHVFGVINSETGYGAVYEITLPAELVANK
jgi:uncharacterized repeat protein (TIGR03803 family)